MTVRLTPEAIADLERCAAELLAIYERARVAAAPHERVLKLRRARFEGRGMAGAFGRGPGNTEEERTQKQAADRAQAGLRNKANQYRQQAETIIKLLEWAAPGSARRLRAQAKATWDLIQRAELGLPMPKGATTVSQQLPKP